MYIPANLSGHFPLANLVIPLNLAENPLLNFHFFANNILSAIFLRNKSAKLAFWSFKRNNSRDATAPENKSYSIENECIE